MRRPALALVALALSVTSPVPATAAEIRVFASVALRLALEELVPRFEERSGHRLTVQYGTASGLKSRIEAGEPFDVAILSPGPTDDLIRTGRLSPDPRSIVGVTVASLAYRSGDPRPDVTTPEAFRATVLAATAISLSDPALGGASSTLFMTTVKRLGLEEAVRGKLVLTGAGDGARPVGAGTAQLGAALSSEVAGVPGVSGVPLLPGDPAGTTLWAATLSGQAAEPEAARAVIGFLLSPEAAAVSRAKGLMAE